jgi:hypothetical protein
MAQSRYLQTQTMQDMNVPDPRDIQKSEPLHYATYNYPLDYSGLANIDFLANIEYFEYVWQLGDRMDQLANRFYADDQYWWVIATVNAISYPLGVKIGTVLRIPQDVNDVLQKLDLI